MINKQLLASLFENYIPELGNNLADVILFELYIQYEKYYKATDILERHFSHYGIYSPSLDSISKCKHSLIYMVFPPNYVEKEVQAFIFRTVMPIIVSNFIVHIKHNPLNKTQIVSMNVWINQLYGLGLSGTAQLLDRAYIHHSLSL